MLELRGLKLLNFQIENICDLQVCNCYCIEIVGTTFELPFLKLILS